MNQVIDDLELLVRSRYALIVLETYEEERADAFLRHVATKLSIPLLCWSRSRGLRRGTSHLEPAIDGTAEPAAALSAVEREGSGIYHFPGFDAYLEDALIAAHVKDAVVYLATRRGAIVVSGVDVRLPISLRAHAVTVRVPAPAIEEYAALLERVLRTLSAKMPIRVDITPADRSRLVKNLMGLTMIEAEKIVSRILLEDAALTERDVERVSSAKRQVIEQGRLLEYEPARQGMNDVAGLAGLKEWLAKRKLIVADPNRAEAFGLSFPKGVLLLGVPGCGKSLCAKSVAREWGLPLLRLDPANLYDRYMGDSEKNFRRALQTAERMAPVVLWIDELEKAFASSGSEEDGGVSRRIFGSFLSWLQDRQGDVFVVATSNDVTTLPPEFIRKGRFDEVFFVDLPSPEVRREILSIHLAKRKQQGNGLDLDAVVRATEGFSGAELEQAIVAALYTAFARGSLLTTEILMEEVAETRPLARTMPERIAGLREWAKDRTVAAD